MLHLAPQLMLSWSRAFLFWSFQFKCQNICFISICNVRLLIILTKKTPEKTVNRMSLVVLDIECIENNIVEELEVYKDGQTVGYFFLPPKKFNTIT